MISVELGNVSRPRQWPVVSSKNMFPEGFPVFGANGPIGFIDRITHSRETIAVGCRGSCGEVHLVPANSYINGNAMALDELDEKRVNRRYLYRWLRYRGFRDVISGSSQPQIIQENIRRVDVPLRPLPEQERIAAILDQADDLRRRQSDVTHRLRSLSVSLFAEIFADAIRDHRSYCALGDLCDVRDGTHDSPKYVEEGIPLLTSKNFSKGRLDLDGARKISRFDFDLVNRRSKVDRGDIVMPMIGTIGSPVIIDEEPMFAIKNVALAKMKGSSLTSEFVKEVLDGPLFQRHVADRGRGGTQKFVSLGDIREFLVPRPSSDAMQKHQAALRSIAVTRGMYQKKAATLDSLFISLEHRAFRGELCA